ncbi:MAG: DUF4236 domain-containing protein [Bacteroidetes bacterium]|nr:DUF4236 domain-containing protein [Bacteroidota bacterium]
MGWYFRKSFGAGPFRVNLSKSGLSYSFGAKGARINYGPRGTYVNFGSNGIYYRKKIGGFSQKTKSKQYDYTPQFYTEQHTITSGDIDKITDTDSQDFINELTEKSGKISYFRVFGILPFILSILALLGIFFLPNSPLTSLKTETHIVVNIRNDHGKNLNIRSKPQLSSNVLGVLAPGQKLKLVDEIDTAWYKVDYKGNPAYINKSYANRISEEITSSSQVYNAYQFNYQEYTILFWVVLFFILIGFLFLLRYLAEVDRRRLLIEINYEIDDSIKEVYDNFVKHFAEILSSSRVWQYIHSKATNDYKYSSGAGSTITRKLLTKLSTNKMPSRLFVTNVDIPYIGLINAELYFFPERLIIKRGTQFGAIMYRNINAYGSLTRFIETDNVPVDSKVVDKTWRYLNKDGGPDRRFRNNYQIPICQYSEYSFESSSGLNERIATSKAKAFDEFIYYIRAISTLQQKFSSTLSKHKSGSNTYENGPIKNQQINKQFPAISPKTLVTKSFFAPGFLEKHLDPLFEEAAIILLENRMASTSLIQRKLDIGYNRAGRLMDLLESEGLVSPFKNTSRLLLVNSDQELRKEFERILAKYNR